MADQPDPNIVADETARQPAGTGPTAPAPVADAPSPALGRRRRRGFAMLAAAVGAVALIALLYHLLIGAGHVSTDNAYVGADTAQITPLVAGAVSSVRVANTQAVKAGDVLLTIDPEDARIAAERARADLSAAERTFRESNATGGALAAQITARESDIARAQAELIVAQAQYDKARVDLDRRQNLARSGAVSGDELTSARTAFAAARGQVVVAQAAIRQAQATRAAARESYAANRAVAGGAIAENPEVAAARSRYDAARLDLQRTVIRAPFDGLVAQRNVQVGQRVAAGASLMTIVPLTKMYVDANFKESQLKRVRIGQPVHLTSDLYGGDVVYHGRVVGLAGGTGSAFALIPAQNATGNWIKVVQRLPVRVALDPQELTAHPLRVGLSMDATIDVSDR